jgi:hypothetical protein
MAGEYHYRYQGCYYDPVTSFSELFDDRSIAGLPILELDVVDIGRSTLGIGLGPMTVAPIDEGFRIDVRAKSDIANALDLFALPSDKGFPVFIRGGHVSGIGKDRKRPAVGRPILEPGNSYDIVQSDTSSSFIGEPHGRQRCFLGPVHSSPRRPIGLYGRGLPFFIIRETPQDYNALLISAEVSAEKPLSTATKEELSCWLGLPTCARNPQIPVLPGLSRRHPRQGRAGRYQSSSFPGPSLKYGPAPLAPCGTLLAFRRLCDYSLLRSSAGSRASGRRFCRRLPRERSARCRADETPGSSGLSCTARRLRPGISYRSFPRR